MTGPDFEKSRQLDGKELLSSVFVASAMSVNNPGFDEVDLPEEIMATLDQLTGISHGPYDAGDWICINPKTGEVGRAYKFDSEYRIVDAKVTETMVDAAIKARYQERINNVRSKQNG